MVRVFSLMWGCSNRQRPGPPKSQPQNPPPWHHGTVRFATRQLIQHVQISIQIWRHQARRWRRLSEGPMGPKVSSTYAMGTPSEIYGSFIYIWVLIKGKPKGVHQPGFYEGRLFMSGGVCYGGTLWLTIAMIKKGSHFNHSKRSKGSTSRSKGSTSRSKRSTNRLIKKRRGKKKTVGIWNN